jgi:hypothetical protein
MERSDPAEYLLATKRNKRSQQVVRQAERGSRSELVAPSALKTNKRFHCREKVNLEILLP